MKKNILTTNHAANQPNRRHIARGHSVHDSRFSDPEIRFRRTQPTYSDQLFQEPSEQGVESEVPKENGMGPLAGTGALCTNHT